MRCVKAIVGAGAVACVAAAVLGGLGIKIADAQAPSSVIAFYPGYCKDLTGKTDCSSGFARWIAAGINATAGADNKFISPHFFGNVANTGDLVGVTIQ